MSTAIGPELKDVFTSMWERIVDVVPGILGAIIILLIGYFVAWLIYHAIEKALLKIKIDKWIVEKTGLKTVIGKFKLSHFLATIAKWYVFILFFPSAAEVVQLGSLSSLLMDLSLWIPNLIAALVIVIIGTVIANYTKIKIQQISFHNAKAVGLAARVVVMVFTLLIALEQLGFNLSVATDSFLILLGGVVLALSLGFGLGMRPEAEKIIKNWRKKNL